LPKFSFYYSIKFWFVSFGFIFVYRLTSIEPRDYRVVFVIQKTVANQIATVFLRQRILFCPTASFEKFLYFSKYFYKNP